MAGKDASPRGLKLRGWWLLGLAALGGCSAKTDAEERGLQAAPPAAAQKGESGESVPFEKLPVVDESGGRPLFVQRLAKPTSSGEDAAVSMNLATPANKELSKSLVRVLGDEKNPVVVFNSDVLADLGQIPKSPGKGFFTAFAQLPVSELERRAKNEEEWLSGGLGETTKESIQFSGRHPVSRATGIKLDLRLFMGGELTKLGVCPVRPVSNAAAWGKTLLITDPAVVQDAARTWDPCTGAGTKGGVWTFAHLMREMSQGSGQSPSDFVKNWLTHWLNDATINGDTVVRRPAIFTEVIQPWANASGVLSSVAFNSATGRHEVLLSGPLDLDIAPFRLLAIVNRIDLSQSTVGGYGGSTTAGELRFVFGVTQPSPWGAGTEATCGLKPFTTIFEYGVPRSGCQQVIDWAKQWAQLGTHATFDALYRSRLATMTQSVVLHGKAPNKGNQNALNQLRTNEIALDSQWELREFTLSHEDPVAGTDTPANGGLRVHTVALTPDDQTHAFNNDPDVSSLVMGPVKAGVQSPLMIPTQCTSSFSVPFSVNGNPFRGGNALVFPPTHWEAIGANPTVAADVCARKEFSINTCNGCHFGDSGTNDLTNTNNLSFTHISPTSGIPVRMSKFLTGGGPGFMFNVPDTQFGAGTAVWSFADLERRFQRLYDIATCSVCTQRVRVTPGFLKRIEEVAGVVPIDSSSSDKGSDFKVGPITNKDVVRKLLEERPKFKSGLQEEPVDFLQRPVETFVH